MVDSTSARSEVPTIGAVINGLAEHPLIARSDIPISASMTFQKAVDSSIFVKFRLSHTP